MTDNEVRVGVYEYFLAQGRAPSPADMDMPPGEAEAAFQRLHDSHVIVLKPDSHEIWMANPWSAVPTNFTVTVAGRDWWGNCIWDALGVVAMLGGTGTVTTTCGDCDYPIRVDVEDYGLQPATGIVHFAVPAAHWWDDIGHT